MEDGRLCDRVALMTDESSTGLGGRDGLREGYIGVNLDTGTVLIEAFCGHHPGLACLHT